MRSGGVARLSLFQNSESAVYGASQMRLAGYTLGQIAVIGLIAVLSVYCVRKVNNVANVPGLHQLAEGL